MFLLFVTPAHLAAQDYVITFPIRDRSTNYCNPGPDPRGLVDTYATHRKVGALPASDHFVDTTMPTARPSTIEVATSHKQRTSASCLCRPSRLERTISNPWHPQPCGGRQYQKERFGGRSGTLSGKKYRDGHHSAPNGCL
ncbi:hypothetical protein MAPG_05687 [Magnaporthiopsis poae ATCC 64411]|uniref:Uncharacterized protein n=1 Tax=Magnaporthiopsis poae (strain ATCC 64411 / 73-15) TaxID=644358 RepID=A0A0C4E021_MAGP6|nr:hypothetical protein MAPG_05687 [Magnaporthiopsis poae ATCC 64411]